MTQILRTHYISHGGLGRDPYGPEGARVVGGWSVLFCMESENRPQREVRDATPVAIARNESDAIPAGAPARARPVIRNRSLTPWVRVSLRSTIGGTALPTFGFRGPVGTEIRSFHVKHGALHRTTGAWAGACGTAAWEPHRGWHAWTSSILWPEDDRCSH